MRLTGQLSALPALLALTAACYAGPDEEAWTSPVAFDTARAWVYAGPDSTELLVELAKSDAQHQFGLMQRPTLDPGSGMVFLYEGDQPGDAGFWMARTKVPLDIAFVDSAGVIRSILTMEPCDITYYQNCPTYPPGIPYRAALEVNRGWFAQHGVELGDRVVVDTAGVP